MDNCRIETREEVKDYLARLKYALQAGARVSFQMYRYVDGQRDEEHTNTYTITSLFPNEDPVEAVKNEIRDLKVSDYMRTVKDIRFPNKAEMREFGKVYLMNTEQRDVYIKLRVELVGERNCGVHTVFIMSFHFAEKPFSNADFPHR